MKGKSVLITGGAGFIGGTLARKLTANNRVVVFDAYRRHTDEPISLIDGVEYVRGDVLDHESLMKTMRDCDVVIHAAGVAGIDTVGKSPVSTLRINAFGTDAVLRAAVEVGVRDRVVCFSTSEVFGEYAFDVQETSKTSVGPVGEPRWTYAASKLLAEHLAYAYWHEYRLPTVVVRPFNVYGPGQIGEGAIKKFIAKAIAGEDIEVNGHGNQIRSWCFINDFMEGLMRCVEDPAAIGHSFNLGNAQAVSSTLDLAQRVIKLARSSSHIRHVPALNADIQVRVPNTSKARELLGFEAEVGLDEGLERTISHVAAPR